MKLTKYILLRFIFLIIMLLLIQSIVYYVFNLAMLQGFALPHPVIDDIKYITTTYPDFLYKFLHFDLGTNFKGIPVKDLLSETIFVSLKINFVALACYFGIGVLLGYIGAMNRGKIIDKIISVFTLITGSIPSFLSVFVYILLFSYLLHWFPPTFTMEYGTFSSIKALFIPVLSLSLPPILKVSRAFRGEILENLDSDIVLLAKIKGFSTKEAIKRHGFKSSLISIFPIITSVFVYALTTSFFIENVYSINGIASLFYDSLLLPYFEFSNYFFIDMDVALATTMFYVVLGLFINLVFDVLTIILDPRVTMHTK